jgi:hypothetical protein
MYYFTFRSYLRNVDGKTAATTKTGPNDSDVWAIVA